jgi:hypothetical protein
MQICNDALRQSCDLTIGLQRPLTQSGKQQLRSPLSQWASQVASGSGPGNKNADSRCRGRDRGEVYTVAGELKNALPNRAHSPSPTVGSAVLVDGVCHCRLSRPGLPGAIIAAGTLHQPSRRTERSGDRNLRSSPLTWPPSASL